MPYVASTQDSAIALPQALEGFPSLSVAIPEPKIIILSLLPEDSSNPSHKRLHEGLSKYKNAHASQVSEYHATAHSAYRLSSVCISK